MSQTCVSFFCGCQYYLGIEDDITFKVYFSIFFTISVLVVAVKIGSSWFIFKDYYPMKQRSPILCILMIACISIQLIIYPIAYTYNYFTRNWAEFKDIYRTLFYAFDGSIYFIYLLRSLRLVYAHEIDTSRSKTKIFKFFKHQYNLLLFTAGMIITKIIPILVSNDWQDDYFLTFIDLNYLNSSIQLGFGIKQAIHQFAWLSILIYCLLLQTSVHKTYSMKNQLIVVLAASFISNLVSIILYTAHIGQISIINSICDIYPQYPLLQLIRDINMISIYTISIIYPLFKKRVYHMMLPIGRHHDIVKTMRDFLMTTQFIQIFSAFLQQRDRQKDQTTYSDSLEYWKKLMVIKYRANSIDLNTKQEDQCIRTIKQLIRDIQDKPLKEIHLNLINNLKQSILSLQEYQELKQVQERERLLDEIKDKIEQLELVILQKLDHIYKTEYRQTKSYYYLKMYLLKNKKININMITMGMAVMVQSEERL